VWGSYPPSYPPTSAPTGSTPTGTSLAIAQALLATNPGLLTQAQWQQLQASGLVASTVPYSSAGQVGPSGSTVDPNAAPAAAPVATGTDIGTMLSTPYLGLPLYLWLGIGAGGLYFFTQKRGR